MIELPPGTPVGKYEVVRKIATGGMAEIYLACARGTAGFEKLVVLKRILPHLASDPSFVQMFLDEARLAATLQHPNIADVYDVGEADGAYFFTMEYIHGQDVRALRHAERTRGQRVPLAIALAVVHGTLAALDYAHDKKGSDGHPLGLVHRDVSSSNVLVSYDGAVKLVDFGIARASGSQHKTRTGTLKGKIPYMSPEQARGQPMDRRSDLFSLGVVLYELTVGRRPFRGDSDFAILERIVHYGARPPSQVVAGYPAELEAIVMRLLQRDPAARYATGEEALHELEQVISQYQLWVSPKVVGKYMRGLFAAHVDAWQAAEQRGVAFADHVARTIQTHRSEILTPPSAIPAVAPPIDDDDDPPDDTAAMPLGSGVSGVGTANARPGALAAVAPSMPVRRASRAPWFAVAMLVFVVAGIGAYAFVNRDAGETTAREETPAPTPSVPPARPPARPPVAPVPAPAVVVAAPQPAPAPEPVAATTPAGSAGSAAPTVRKLPSVVTTRTAAQRAAPAPAPKPDTKPPSWDPNSPFLPGQ